MRSYERAFLDCNVGTTRKEREKTKQTGMQKGEQGEEGEEGGGGEGEGEGEGKALRNKEEGNPAEMV